MGIPNVQIDLRTVEVDISHSDEIKIILRKTSPNLQQLNIYLKQESSLGLYSYT